MRACRTDGSGESAAAPEKKQVGGAHTARGATAGSACDSLIAHLPNGRRACASSIQPAVAQEDGGEGGAAPQSPHEAGVVPPTASVTHAGRKLIDGIDRVGAPCPNHTNCTAEKPRRIRNDARRWVHGPRLCAHKRCPAAKFRMVELAESAFPRASPSPTPIESALASSTSNALFRRSSEQRAAVQSGKRLSEDEGHLQHRGSRQRRQKTALRSAVRCDHRTCPSPTAPLNRGATIGTQSGAAGRKACTPVELPQRLVAFESPKECLRSTRFLWQQGGG